MNCTIDRFLIGLLLLITGWGCHTGPTPVQTGFIPAGGLKVYYERQGKGPALLLLHAGLQNHTMWQPQVATLSKQYDVVTIDLPYHGQTTGQDTTILVQDVIRVVLDSLHIQKVSLVGLSMGSNAVQDFIIAYPQRVNKAILISAGINGYDRKYPIDSASMDWAIKFGQALEKRDTAMAAREFTKAWAEGIYRSGDSLQQPVSKYVLATTLTTLRQHKAAGWPRLLETPPAMERIATIQVPVLIINGDKDLPYVTTVCNYLEKTIPGAKHVVMKDVAHMLNMEKPEELNAMTRDFLRRE
jgi:3-oxoadipate enol-lactonase